MLGKKRIFFLSIFFIALYALIVGFVYPELEVTALVTVITLLGIASGLIAHYLLPKTKTDQGNGDE